MELDVVIRPESIGKRHIYTITCVQFPHIVTQGSTVEEAKENLREAVSLYLECAPKEVKKIMAIETKKEKYDQPMISRVFL